MILIRLKVEASTRNDTAWTDGVTLGYNPDFIDSIDDKTIEAMLAHEAGHVAMNHPFRLKPRHDPKKANMAMDHAINLPLKDYRTKTGAAPFVIPPDWLADCDYAGMAWEEIYDRLPPGQGGNGQQAGKGDGPGEVMPFPADSPAEAQEAEARNIQATTQAAQAASAYGELPADIARMIEELRKPAVHWADALRQFLTRSTSESSWKTPRRRALASGMYLPSRTGQQCPPLVIAIDTSASVTPAQLEQFAAEINSIAADVQPERITVIYCDSRVRGAEEFERGGDPIVLHPKGGGGTRFNPVFDYVSENMDEPPAALVYLSDLDGPDPAEPPPYPVLWVSTDRRAASLSFGERIDMVA
jgi:predicted metal-dependent peptidase